MNKLVYLMGEEEEFARKFSTTITEKNIFALNKELSLAHEHISANGNAKIVFLDLGLRIAKIIK